jgi:aminoglycoside phosphotransferase (APT) family kinase protein
MFPDYDLGRQVACMQALARHPECPVPAIIGADLEGCVIGRPFYVMEFVEGEVPADDRPTFAEAGFLFTASVEEQRRFHGSFLDVLAALHSLPIDPALARMLERLGRGETALERRVSWLEELCRWGRGPAEQPVLERAFAWIARHLPADNRASLVWGDARPANAVVRDFRVVAMLDWELAALGPPELDLFWFLEMNRMRSNGRPLPGFLAPDEAIADYESRADHSVRDAHFHQVFAALQVAVLMLRHLRVAVERGELDEGHKVMTDNTATRRLAALVDRG